jgi:7-dehydrocholesterol reductase
MYFLSGSHFHYVPEIMASVFWCIPALQTSPIPYFYPVYLTILLCDRAWRDDARCKDKYGKFWDEYCAAVPYKIIPGGI